MCVSSPFPPVSSGVLYKRKPCVVSMEVSGDLPLLFRSTRRWPILRASHLCGESQLINMLREAMAAVSQRNAHKCGVVLHKWMQMSVAQHPDDLT